MGQPFTIGMDIGTTSTKAVLYDAAFAALDTATVGYPTIRTEEGMAEQDPLAIQAAVLSVLKTVLDRNASVRDQIASVAFSCAMHSVLLVSETGEPVTPVYTWADNRSNPTLQALQAETDLQWVYQKTGTPIHSMSPFSKLLWLQAEHPEWLSEGVRIVGIKEYITHHFTGEWKVDYSIASATGLFNLERLDWDDDILDFVGVNRKAFSEPVDTNAVFGGRIEGAYAAAGLPLTAKLVIGASDGCLANLGLNAIGNNEAAMTIGTSGAVRMVSDPIALDPEGRTFCYYLAKDKWVVGGAVNNGGNAFEWIATMLSKDGAADYAALNALAASIEAGSDGLLFFPYLNGERAPLWDAAVQAHFVGLTAIHTPGHLVRSVMEGVLFNLAEVLHILETFAGPARSLKVTGGFLHSPLWKQMTADILNKTLTLSPQFESSCLGAALIGQEHTPAFLETMEAEEVVPDEATAQVYAKTYALYYALAKPIKEIHAIKAAHCRK